MMQQRGVFTLYLGRIFLVRFVGFLIFFVIILQMLDLLNQSDAILEAEGANTGSLLRYVSLRAPQIISQFTPFAALLGIVVTLAGLSHTSEITVMRAAGMSVHRVLFPLGVVCAVIAAAHFVFHETVTVERAETLEYWEANDFALDLPQDASRRTDIRIRHEGVFIGAASAARHEDAVTLTDMTIYEFSDKGLTTKLIEAKSARHQGGVWRLFGVQSFDAINLEATQFDELIWTNSLNPDLIFSLTLRADQTSLGEMLEIIAKQRADNTDTREAMTSFLSRFSMPAATLVMPLLGAIAGFGVHRQGVLLMRAVTGSAIGFAYFVIENLSLALGKLGIIPATIGAFFPFALFLVVGFAIILAMEN